jgi:hypothetical protein
MKDLYSAIHQEIELNSEKPMAWQGTKLDHLFFGARLPSFFLQHKPFLLENKKVVKEIIKYQESQGIPKSYEMVALQMHNMSLKKTFPEIRKTSEKFDVYFIRPVRKATEKEITTCKEYVENLKKKGLKVWDPIDTPQEDNAGGFTIVENHFYEIWNSDETHCYWNGSTGSHVDLGTAMVKHLKNKMPIRLANKEKIIGKNIKLNARPKTVDELVLLLDYLA